MTKETYLSDVEEMAAFFDKDSDNHDFLVKLAWIINRSKKNRSCFYRPHKPADKGHNT